MRRASRAGVLWPALLALVHVAVVALNLAAPSLSGSVASGTSNPDSGAAYIAAVPFDISFPFVVVDDASRSSGSVLELREDGKLLGPAHTSHAAVRERGGGAYSHWGKAMWFSASDSSDPRSNGRAYVASTTASVHPAVPAAVAVFDALLAVLLRRRLLAFMTRRWAAVVNGAIVVGVALAALAALGLLGRINGTAGAPKDVALVVATVVHALLGLALLAAHLIAGSGVSRLLLGRTAGVSDVLLLGFPLGMAISAALAATALAAPHGPVLAALLWSACSLGLLGWRVDPGELRALGRVALTAAPFALSYGCWLALLWHGPTETLSGNPSGDLIYYSTSISSLSSHPYPHLNLGYERVPFGSYFNMLVPAIGAALTRVVAIDPFLFSLACGSSFFVLGLVIALYAFTTGEPSAERTKGRWPVVVLWLAVLVANRYPYWTAESLPFIYTVPVTVAVAHWARKPQTRAGLVALAIAIIGSALSKVVTATALGAYAMAAALPRFWAVSRVGRIAAVIVAALCAVYATVLLVRFGPIYFGITSFGPLSLTRLREGATLGAALPFLLRDAAAVLLAVVAFLIAPRLLAAAILFGLVVWQVHPFTFFPNFVCCTVLIALLAYDRPAALQRHLAVTLAALLLAMPANLATDPAGYSSGAAWVLCIGGAAASALLLARGQETSGIVRTALLRTAGGLALIVSLTLVGVARGHVILNSGWGDGSSELTPALREVWLAVKRLTPEDALIFTDQTALEPRLLGGWNTYVALGGRQVFVSNLYMNEATRLNENRAISDLRENDAVLSGELAPEKLIVRGRYGSYFAVVSAARRVPSTWRRIFENARYAVYEIPRIL